MDTMTRPLPAADHLVAALTVAALGPSVLVHALLAVARHTAHLDGFTFLPATIGAGLVLFAPWTGSVVTMLVARRRDALVTNGRFRRGPLTLLPLLRDPALGLLLAVQLAGLGCGALTAFTATV